MIDQTKDCHSPGKFSNPEKADTCLDVRAFSLTRCLSFQCFESSASTLFCSCLFREQYTYLFVNFIDHWCAFRYCVPEQHHAGISSVKDSPEKKCCSLFMIQW